MDTTKQDGRSIKPLIQSDFKMKIIKDLGTRLPESGKGKKIRYAIFECDTCGKHIKSAVNTRRISKHGKCRSCLNSMTSTKYEKFIKPLYDMYRNIKQRCYNKSNNQYMDYGDRGVYMCDEWLNDYITFQKWALENGYKKGLVIDKDIKSSQLGYSIPFYSPETCTFVTSSQNNLFTRKRSDNTSGYIGVVWHNQNEKWYGSIEINGIKKGLGKGFNNKEECAKARDKYIIDNNIQAPLSGLPIN